MSTLTDAQADLFLAPNIGSVATIRDDGSAHPTPAWVDWDGEHVLVNTVVGRVKERHPQRTTGLGVGRRRQRPGTLRVGDGHGEHSAPTVRVDHIDAMANKYLGLERYLPEFGEPGDVRVIARIEPTLVTDWNI